MNKISGVAADGVTQEPYRKRKPCHIRRLSRDQICAQAENVVQEVREAGIEPMTKQLDFCDVACDD